MWRDDGDALLRQGTSALLRVSLAVTKLERPDAIQATLATTVRESFGLAGAALYIDAGDGSGLYLAAAHGAISAAAQLCQPHLEDAEATVVPWCAVFPDTAAVSEGRPPEWHVAVPLRVNGTSVGLLALGPKQSGEAIGASERELLGVVGAHLAIALRGAEYARRLAQQQAELATLHERLQRETEVVRAEARCTAGFRHIVGVSPSLRQALELVEKSAPSDAAILITGETGTGKELVARAIHELSRRSAGPLVSVNCPAIPSELAESELFGHERGAFTGAVDGRSGKLESADHGTVFLDEVADLPMAVQVKLLRVLQEHEVQRVGSHKTRKLDIRIVAATNRDLRHEAAAGRFREDLYFRLAALPIRLPALRERIGDIPMLATHFLERAATTHGKPVRGFTSDAMALLDQYAWPGNVRELQHVIERAVLLCSSDRIQPNCLVDFTSPAPPPSLGASLRAEKLRRVEAALAQTHGNQAAAARLLGMSRSNFARLLKTLRQKEGEAYA
jgi:transcriptional regulator with GAF, ATPase, and Fis domain